jgi:accessory colonization factor AcfC
MSKRWRVLFAGLLLHAATAGATPVEPVKVLKAYGPGGPHHVLQECADLYREKSGVAVGIVKASPRELVRKIQQDGDIYFGGAEYMVEDFVCRNPGLLDPQTIEKLHPRRIGLLVRKGNPLGLKGTGCLERNDVDLLAVKLENMDQFHPERQEDGTDPVCRQEYSGQDGVEAWRESPEIDAWVTYKSWHVALEEESEFIEIPCKHALRHTTVALTRRTPNREAALRFIGFLKSPEARKIFVEHGWD